MNVSAADLMVTPRMLGTDAGVRGRAHGASNTTNFMGLQRAAAAVRKSQQGGKGLRRRSMDGRSFGPGVRVVASGRPAALLWKRRLIHSGYHYQPL